MTPITCPVSARIGRIASGSFDAVTVPSFGSWPPVYPEHLENLLADAVPDIAVDLCFALAHIGLHTTFDPSVPEDAVWLLDGWSSLE